MRRLALWVSWFVVSSCRQEDPVVHEEVPGADVSGPADRADTRPTVASRPIEDVPSPRPRWLLDEAFIDPEDDPELTDEYFDSVEEGTAAEPPPRPQGLPGDRAFSVGPPNGGWLIGGKPMPARGARHRVLPGTLQRGWYFGTESLLGVLRRASEQVGKRHGGAPLRVGNLSRREGGKIAPSVSHQSGRDADLGIYATDLDGVSVDPGGFPKFDSTRGDPLVDTTGNYLFDVVRNWAFVEALLSDPQVEVQWIFLDDPLRDLLLDHGARTLANSELIKRAEKVIVRPRNSSPHANHYHIRVFCSPGDLEYGCKDLGPEWEWVKEERAIADELLDRTVDDVMAGRKRLDLMNPEHPDAHTLRAPPINLAPLPGSAPPSDLGPDPASPLDLPDPPTDVPLRD